MSFLTMISPLSFTKTSTFIFFLSKMNYIFSMSQRPLRICPCAIICISLWVDQMTLGKKLQVTLTPSHTLSPSLSHSHNLSLTLTISFSYYNSLLSDIWITSWGVDLYSLFAVHKMSAKTFLIFSSLFVHLIFFWLKIGSILLPLFCMVWPLPNKLLITRMEWKLPS
jgi:hypothetical protein